MIEVTEAFKNAWLNGNQKHIQLDFSDNTSLEDDGIVVETQNLTQTLCEDEQLAFGLTSSACYKIQVLNTGKQYKGLSVNPRVADSSYQHIFSLGTYKIMDDERSEDKMYRQLTAYDALYDVLNTDYSTWYGTYFTNNPNPTFKQFRDAFFSNIGITQEEVELITDEIILKFKPELSSYSGSEIIRDICEPNAAFGFLNYDGKFQYVVFDVADRKYPADDLYPSDRLYPGDPSTIIIRTNDDVDKAPTRVAYSDYFTHKITQAKFNSTANTGDVVVGTIGNCYEFRENILLYNQIEDVLRSIATKFLENVKGLFYNPATVEMRTRLWIQLGDILDIVSTNGGVRVPVLKRTLNGITACYDTYEARGTEFYVYSPNSQSDVVADFESYKADNRVELKKLEDSIYASVGKTIDVWDDSESNISLYGFGEPFLYESDSIIWDLGQDIYDIEDYGKPSRKGYKIADAGLKYFDLYLGDAYELTVVDVPVENLPEEGVSTSPNPTKKTVKWQFMSSKDYPGYYDGEYTPDDAGLLYLDDETGKVYELQTYTTQVGNYSGYKHTVTGVEWVYSEQLTTTKAELSTRITQTASAITSEATRATSAESALSTRISQTATSVSITASDNNTSAGIVVRLYDENGRQLDSDSANITMSGLVKFVDLSTSGSTTINGSNITTGILDATKVTVNNLDASKITSGTMSGNRISGGTITGVQVEVSNRLRIIGDDNYDSIWLNTSDGNSLYISKSASLTGNAIVYCGTLYSSGSLNCDVNVNCSGNVTGSHVVVSNPSTGSYSADVNMSDAGSLRKVVSSSRRWKHDITKEIDSWLDPHKLLDVGIYQYKYNSDYLDDSTDERYLTDVVGFIAEDVANKYPVACDWDENVEPADWNARFLIPPMLALIQEQDKRISSLENEIKELKDIIKKYIPKEE